MGIAERQRQAGPKVQEAGGLTAVDARYPTKYLNDRRILNLSHEAHVLMMQATAFSVTNMTDGFLNTDDLALIPRARIEAANELVQAGLWEVTKAGWFMPEFPKHQTSKDQLEALERKRQQDRQNSKSYRERQKHRTSFDASGTESSDASADELADESSDDIGKERQGKARQGKEELTSSNDSERRDREWLEGKSAQVPVTAAAALKLNDPCVTPGCDGRLNQAQVNMGASICAECTYQLARQGKP
ncbi:hypothetical protein [Arthrobacter sp. H-02-3]|uniref:hypothetical protein n=1 Tax=Arthrobacter sp. H-02-3 TaxID=2703675 RepID=UPI000DD1D680|nr:hypothetical protein [Arthrobacter sp. H-02-3]PVZ56690.1 hypothetical protein C9424_10785 [Arthrobacter sp. H-02-3]